MSQYFQIATAEIALTAATARTVIQVQAAANRRIRLLSWGVYFDGISATAEPVQVRLLRQTTGGTMTPLGPSKRDDSISDAVAALAFHSATAEPGPGNVIEVKEVHPQGCYEKVYARGQEPVVAGSNRMGIECTAPAGVNVRAEMVFEE